MAAEAADAFSHYRAGRPGPSGGLVPNLIILVLAVVTAFIWMEAYPRFATAKSTGPGVRRTDTMPNGVLTIVQLDVGQGDAAFIHTPSGKNILIDVGEGNHHENAHSKQYPAAFEVTQPFLQAHGIFDIDLLILTHPDSDHGGGMAELIDWLYEHGGSVKLFLESGKAKPAKFYVDLLKAVERHNIPYMSVLDATTGLPAEYPDFGGTLIGKDILKDPDVVFQILGPLSMKDAANDNSLVTRIVCGDISLLSAGDAEEPEEDEVAAFWGPKLRSMIHFAPHHGSKTSDQPNWLRMVNPEIISSSSHPPVFGHPAAAVIAAWEAIIKPIPKLFLRTDMNGDIWFRTDGKKLEIRTQFEVRSREEQWKPAKIRDWEGFRRFASNPLTIWSDCIHVPGTDVL